MLGGEGEGGEGGFRDQTGFSRKGEGFLIQRFTLGKGYLVILLSFFLKSLLSFAYSEAQGC